MKRWRKWKIFIREISFQFFLFILSLNSIHCVSSCYNPFVYANLISELMQNWWSHQDKFYIYMPFAIHNAYITTAIQMYRNLNVFTKNNDCLLHARTVVQYIQKMNRQIKVNNAVTMYIWQNLCLFQRRQPFSREKREKEEK